MREIKFRAWHEATKSWLQITGFETDFVDSDNGKTATLNTGVAGMFHDGDYIGSFKNNKGGNGVTLVQYTGLKDKNGKEIFEGDVYGYTMTIDGSHWNEHQVQSSDVVKFETGAFYHGEHLLSDVIEYDNTLTYLGNIYENPELLEVAV